jgi:5-methylcytosine-specific restriction endonuclease McrA
VTTWGGRRLQRLAHQLAALRLPCALCGQPIDYDLPRDDAEAFTIDHRIPRSQRPDLAWDPSNLQPAHAKCNKRRGNRDNRPEIGAGTVSW